MSAARSSISRSTAYGASPRLRADIVVNSLVGFAVTTAFWPLLLIAFVGTMNPTSGDASIFLPLEQALGGMAARSRSSFDSYSLMDSLRSTTFGGNRRGLTRLRFVSESEPN